MSEPIPEVYGRNKLIAFLKKYLLGEAPGHRPRIPAIVGDVAITGDLTVTGGDITLGDATSYIKDSGGDNRIKIDANYIYLLDNGGNSEFYVTDGECKAYGNFDVGGDLTVTGTKKLYLAGDGSTTYIHGATNGLSVTIDAEDYLYVNADSYISLLTPLVLATGRFGSLQAGTAANPQFAAHQTIGADDYARISFDSTVESSKGPLGYSHEWTVAAKPTAEGAQASAVFNIFYGDQNGSGGGANILQCTGDGDVDVLGTLSKGAGSFKIPHPDPEKEKTHTLWHSFIESPTAGENLYRWQLDVTGGSLTMELPDYYPFLNINDMVWVSPVGHFGAAYGEVSEDQKSLTITANADGKYNVLLIGTRKDEIATNAWKGAEREGPHRRFTENG